MLKKWQHPQEDVDKYFGVKIVWIFVIKLAEPQPRNSGIKQKHTVLYRVQEVMYTLD